MIYCYCFKSDLVLRQIHGRYCEFVNRVSHYIIAITVNITAKNMFQKGTSENCFFGVQRQILIILNKLHD
jgi:hypothetical protein